MRVGLIIYGSLNTLTGGYIYDKILVDYLRSLGVEVKVFSQTHTHFLGLIQQNFSQNMLNEIIQFKPDVLLQDQMNLISLFILNKKFKKMANFPIVSIVHLLSSKIIKNSLLSFATREIEKKYFKSINGFIFNSQTSKELTLRIIKNNTNFLVAYPGKDRLKIHDIDNIIAKKSYTHQLKIIFIGNLFYHKGLHVLIQALSEIDKQLWSLSIIGGLHFDTMYSKKIMEKIACLKLTENIRVLGQLDHENLKKELVVHHVLAVPSYYESFGMVYAEAMGAGLPIIASHSGGAREIVTDSLNGFLVPPGNVSKIKDAVYKLIENRELLKKMSLSSLSSYGQMPTWNDSMASIYQFLIHCCMT